MKISINVVSPFESGGFNTYNKYLVNNIAKLDKKNYYYIYVDYNNFKNYQIYQPNIKIIKKSQLLNNSALRIIWMQFILPFSLIYNQVDIHVSTMNISPLFLKLSRTKSILIQHSNLPWVYPNEFSKNLLKLFLTRSLMSLSIYFSDTVICDTNYARNELINFFPRQRDKIKKAYLAVDRKIFKVKSDINNTEDILSKYSLPKKYFLSIQTEVLDGQIFLSGKVDEPEEKIKITKMAWETKGVRSVKNAISIKGQTNFKSTAKDILITSQLRTALILNKNTKARNYTLETVNKNIYIFGIAMDSEEKKEVINEANKIYDVEEVIPSIYLATELSRTKF